MRTLRLISVVLLLVFFVLVVTGFANAASLAAWGQGEIPAGNDFVDIAAGYNHSLAIRSGGSLVAWGDNGDGQCDVPDGNNFETVAAG